MIPFFTKFMDSFFHHPKSVSMTYIEHCTFSFHLSYLFFCGSVKAFIHAVYPDCYICSSSDYSKLICKMIDDKHELCDKCDKCE